MLRTSKSVSEIAPDFIACQGSFPAVFRTQPNEAFDSKYSDLAALIKATRPKLRKHGLAVIQAPSCDREKELITITTRLQHKSGQFYESDLDCPIFDEDWSNGEITGQVMSSAISYACRIAYKAILGIANPDDDGNAASRMTGRQALKGTGITPPRQPASGHRLEVTRGELIDVVPSQYPGRYFARCVGVPAKLWIERADIRAQLEKAKSEQVELECQVHTETDVWQVVRLLRVGRFDFTKGNEDLSERLEASVHLVKHNIEPPPVTAQLFQEDPF